MKEDFAIRLRKAMNNKNIRASELSKKTLISPPILSDYLKGKYKAKQDNIYILAKVLDVNEAWLMGYDVPYERVPDSERNSNENILLGKIKQLNTEQQKAIINIIDNMK